ncbi:MAG: hypothetical protein GKR87_09665 [Kiritimatiellae bacterium]|nr:hypothetical protein [Kiritimatiellia bacterium]
MKRLKIYSSDLFRALLSCCLLGGLGSGCSQEQEAHFPSEIPTLQKGPFGLSYHALVIGISDYAQRDKNGWTPLPVARHDAEAVANILEQKYHFHVQRLFDKEATRDAIFFALQKLQALNYMDAVLIYFSGHGDYNQLLDEGFWIPSDARKKSDSFQVIGNWIWNTEITRLVQTSGARHILTLSDACFSGSLINPGSVS